MKRLDEDIKNGQFQKVYLLYGEQAYLRNQYRDKLVKAILPEGDTLNYAHYQGKNINFAEIIDLCETMPFMAERRVVVIEDSEVFTKACDELSNYILKMPDSTTLIFNDEKADKRLKMYKAVKDAGYIVNFETPSRDVLKNWVSKKISANHRQITYQALDMFLDSCGNDMMRINTELEKLICYTFGKDGIYPEDVKNICSVQIEDRIFELLEAITMGNRDKAFILYSDLLSLREPPARILYMIVRQLRIMLHISQLEEERKSIDEMARILSMNPYGVKKTLPQIKRRSKLWIVDALNMCAEMENATKVGNIDAQVGLESVIVKLSGV